MENRWIIKLENICFAYDGEIALNGVNLEVREGETVVLQGPNGCGKSTLIRLLNGLIFPELGTFTFDGEEITEKRLKDNIFSKKFHQRIGYIFQNSDVQLFCGSVRDEIAFGPRQMGLDETEVDRRVKDLLKLLDICHLQERAPYHLSGGEKKKVAIACILAMNPEVLIMDEPLAGLDRKSQEWLVDFLLQLKTAGKTLIISTHNDVLAEQLADRIVVMNEEHKICTEFMSPGLRECDKINEERQRVSSDIYEESENFDVVDKNGETTGVVVTRQEAHQGGIRHRTAHIWILRQQAGKVQVLLQKRSLQKDSFPGRYDTSSAGHIQAGDEVLDSALRELEEELGIRAEKEQLQYVDRFRIQYESEFHGKAFRDDEVAFVFAYTEPVDMNDLALQKEEIDSVDWFDLDETYRKCQDHDPDYCVPIGGLELIRSYAKNII